MESKAAKKAKKGFLSIVFSRTALILLLILLQLGMMFVLATKLSDYAIYVYGLQTVIQAGVIIYIFNQKGNPESSRTWILLVLLIPVFGCLFYIYVQMEFGTKYVGERLGRIQMATWPYLSERTEIVDELRVSKPANANLAYYMQKQLHFPTYRNTKALYFPNGQAKFKVMLEKLKNARKYIFLEYFIVAEGYMWDSILDVLKKKAAEGVEVRFMYDGMNSISNLPYNYPKKIRRYGIKCKMLDRKSVV